MTDEERSLILDLGLGRITKQTFLQQYTHNPELDSDHVTQLLRQAEANRADIEEALLVGYAFGFTNDCVPILIELIQQDWHFKHEDIADLLQDFKDPRSIGALMQTALAKFSYRDWDDYGALARRCIWAIGDIDTVESRSTLRTLLSIGDEHIKAAAAEQLNLPTGEQRASLPYRRNRDHRYRHPSSLGPDRP